MLINGMIQLLTRNKTIVFRSVSLLAPLVLANYFLAPTQAQNAGEFTRANKQAAYFIAQSNPMDMIRGWFGDYDQIRRQAQLSPDERRQADLILGRGLSLFMPGPDKAVARQLLTELVRRYQVATQQMSNLRMIAPTEQLHRGYYEYFSQAMRLFSDYLKLQDDLLAVDPNTGQPVASGLVDRKENLARLDENNKALDQQLRAQYGIPPYQY